MVRVTWVQSLVESYQRLKKWYLMPPCLTLSIIRYGSRVKWSNPGKAVAPSPTPRCSSYRKGSLRVILDNSRELYILVIDEDILKRKKIIVSGKVLEVLAYLKTIQKMQELPIKKERQTNQPNKQKAIQKTK